MMAETRERITIDGVEYVAWPEHGAWYEACKVDEIGGLMFPMNADGTPDTFGGATEVAVRYADA